MHVILRRALLALACASLITLLGTAQAFTQTVSNNNGYGDGSLRQAIANAAPGDTIIFSPVFFNRPGAVIPLTSELVIDKPLSIVGPFVGVTLSGYHATRIFHISTGGQVLITGLTLVDAQASNAAGSGGAIRVDGANGSVTFSDCAIVNNNAGPNTGGGAAYIDFNASCAFVNCTLANNSAANPADAGLSGLDGYGGAICCYGTVRLFQCTLSGNRAFQGGGVYLNVAGASAQDCLIAGNMGRNGYPDIRGVFTSGGSNLIGDGTDDYTSGFADGVGHDQVGTQAAPINPLLGQLQNNGGPTPTLALLSGSPAIQAGFSTHLPLDQRGAPRPQPRADVGAYQAVNFIQGAGRSWGNNGTAQLANGTLGGVQTSPGPVVAPPLMVGVAGGAGHSLALLVGGNVWSWGNNYDVQLGQGGMQTAPRGPQQVTGMDGSGVLNDAIAVAAGEHFSLSLQSNGTLFAWGGNDYGQLGNNTSGYNTRSSSPVQVVGAYVSTFTGNVAIASGAYHSLALRCDGTVWSWGRNNFGQLGDGTTQDHSTANPVVNADGSPLSGIVAVSAGALYSLALRADGTVWAWGANSSGQLGNGVTNSIANPRPTQASNLTQVVGIAAGTLHGLALRADGTVFAWGNDGNGQLGDGNGGGGTSGHDSSIPTQVKGVAGSGFLKDVTALAAGAAHSLALLTDGTLVSWGGNSAGQLGNGAGGNGNNAADSNVPVVVSNLIGVLAINGGDSGHSLAIQDQPIAVPDRFRAAVDAGPSLTPPPGVLANDSDNGSPLSATSASTPAHGAVSLNTDGSFVYTPDSTYAGVDSFTYQAHSPYTVSTPVTVTLDGTPPVTTGTLSGTQSASGAYTGPVTVTLSTTDPDDASGLTTFYKINNGAQQTYSQPFTVSADGHYTVAFFSRDPVGNVEAPKTLTFGLDSSAPTTTATRSGTAGTNSYYKGAVRITLSVSDPDDGADTLTTHYTTDGADSGVYTTPFTISGDGTHTVTFFSVDSAGNTEALQTLTIKIDATPPSLTFGTPTPAPNASGYSSATVSIPYTTTDSTSGIATSAPGSPVLFSGEGKYQTQIVTVTDNAGNSADFVTPTVSVDHSAPITTAAGGRTVTLSATDNLSGVAATTYSLDSGPTKTYTGPFSVTGNGPHTVTYGSTDKAGNQETVKTLNFTLTGSAWMAKAVTVGGDGNPRLLWNNADGSIALWRVDTAGHILSGSANFGPFPGWTAQNIAAGADNKTRLLWDNADGQATIWTVNLQGQIESGLNYGPYSGWTAKCISVGPDNRTRLLWTNTSGEAAIWNLDGAGHILTGSANFGPYAGWSAQAIAVGPDNKTRVLWDNTDGHTVLWTLNGQGQIEAGFNYGPFSGWTAKFVSVGSDNRARLQWNNTTGEMALWTLDGAGNVDSARSANFGPYGGWTAQAFAVGPDNKARVLWDNSNGQATLWTVNPQTQIESGPSFGPF